MSLATGDGWFAAVVGKDADGAVSVVVAGPSVTPGRFGIPDADEVAALAAEEAARAALPLGLDGCPLTNWLLSGFDAATHEQARTRAAAFAPPPNARRIRPQQREDGACGGDGVAGEPAEAAVGAE